MSDDKTQKPKDVPGQMQFTWIDPKFTGTPSPNITPGPYSISAPIGPTGPTYTIGPVTGPINTTPAGNQINSVPYDWTGWMYPTDIVVGSSEEQKPIKECSSCNGKGKYIGLNKIEDCRDCKGVGKV